MELTGTQVRVEEERLGLTELASSGLRVLLVRVPWQRSVAVHLRVLRGSGDDPYDRAGLAHLVEHERVAHAATRAPSLPPLAGRTEVAWTDYRLCVPAEHWRDALGQALAVLHHGRLTDTRLAHERQAVVVELARAVGRPALRLGPLLASVAAAGSDLAAVGAATPDSIRSLTSKDVDNFLRDAYQPQHCLLAVTSPIPGAEVGRFLKAHPPEPPYHLTLAKRSVVDRPPAGPEAALSGTLAMTMLAARPTDPHDHLAERLAHLYLTEPHGHLDRLSSPSGGRIVGSAMLVGRQARLTMLSWGQVTSAARLGAALHGGLRAGGPMAPAELSRLRERLYLDRSFESQTPLGLAGQVLRAAAGEDAPPAPRAELERVSARQVDQAIGRLSEAAVLWRIADGLPQPLES
ncbi:hypothetical protein ACN267_21670 [Micromonospora sp. WMMD734]|uniref:hypothetical protein n=1 Tax=unclassified Micromonospora TaxID=2617518 RepID=UPI002417AC80|nr:MULTISPECIES: hypothetical protein [unclassified Micromonospora]MDG4816992.1 hypothetical protein [Micromonospora sp. WMMD956]WFE59491.1 hypothetical protein O7633_22745 [Micromonospora sp. WMMD712]